MLFNLKKNEYSDVTMPKLRVVNCTTGTMTLGDPCYIERPREPSGIFAFSMNLSVKKGRWLALEDVVEMEKSGPLTASLFLVHEDHEDGGSTMEEEAQLCVDSGRVSAVVGKSRKPITVQSGFGDGIYPVRIGREGGEIVSVAVSFILLEDDEDCSPLICA